MGESKIVHRPITPTRIVRWIYRRIPAPIWLRELMGRTIKLIVPWSRRRGVVQDIGANFISSSVPVVSIIIPIHGKIDITLNCLRSISANPQKTNFEIIIVDDFSPDASVKWLSKIPGIRVIANSENKGFIESCNTGAAAGKGKFLHFLNNDTIVTPNWLDELVETFSSHTNAGMAGSKLLYPNGKLQEAGGIIWKDGSAWNYGRFDDPNKPEYNYARQVDYCSGASLLIEKDLFFSFDGFDQHFAPAYCEDSDLALKVTQAGLRVMYQPASTVYHLEGTTSGTDLKSGAKSYQVTNAVKLFQRWSTFLQDHRSNGEEVLSEKDRFVIKRVLFIDHAIPKPDQDAGSVTSINTMLVLREFGFQVTFSAGASSDADSKYVKLLQKLGFEVLYPPFTESLSQHLKEHGPRYDLIFSCRAEITSQVLPIVRMHCPTAPLIFHTIDLHFLRMEREAELLQSKASHSLHKYFKELETWVIEKVDLTIVHSETELNHLITIGLDSRRIIEAPLVLGVPDSTNAYIERNGIAFLGGFQHRPNVDAVKYLCQEIMPLLAEQNPNIILTVAGSNATEEIFGLEAENVKIVGQIGNADEFISKFRLSVAPLRYGAGIKGKVGKSIVNGTPVVASDIATEGMRLVEGEGYLPANNAWEFAKAINRVYEDQALWESLSIKGKLAGEKMWGFNANVAKLSTILSMVDIELTTPSQETNLF